jgi:hypothetical protein
MNRFRFQKLGDSRRQHLILLMILGVLNACAVLEFSEIEVSYPVEALGGPKVIYDFLAKPLPEVPLPNNDATIYDVNSPTKRRINVSLMAVTNYEERAREGFNQLDGFGTYAPIMVSFDQMLDVQDLWDRHNLHAPNLGKYRDDFRDDAVYVLNIEPSCQRYGEEVALDIGRGRFPVTQFRKAKGLDDPLAPQGQKIDFGSLYTFSEFNPYATYNNILFEERNEDLNQNGQLDEGEDLDFDGILDVANLIDPKRCDGLKNADLDRCIADHLMTYYDRNSHTLILRPVWPLEERCTYAVVLTKRLKGENGKSIESPFDTIYPLSQKNDLALVEPLIERYGLNMTEIAFMWSFTTGTQTADLEAVRLGLYGQGPFKNLNEAFPSNHLEIWQRQNLLSQSTQLSQETSDDFYLPGECAAIAFTQYWSLKNEWKANLCALEKENTQISKIFAGTFKAPDLLANQDETIEDLLGNAYPVQISQKYPNTADERWTLEAHQAKIDYQVGEVTFWCALPFEQKNGCPSGNPNGEAFCKPFPVILYAHGYGGSRGEIISGHIGRTTAMGYAICALDSYGHGLNVLLEDNELSKSIKLLFGILGRYGIPDLQALLMRGRDRDLTNDGLQDSGADMWTSDIFHTRDMVRQIALEYSQFIRILRQMDGKTRDQNDHLLGDIDLDGTVDLGGPQNTISMWGISLGGIISGVMAGFEPSLNAVSPNAGGAGLVDIAIRSSQAGVPEAVLLPVLGPFIVGCLPWDEHQNPLTQGTGKGCFSNQDIPYDHMELAFLVNQRASQEWIHFATIPNVKPKMQVKLENLRKKEQAFTQVDQRGRMMIAVQSDALNATEKRSVLGLSDDQTQPVSLYEARIQAKTLKEKALAIGDPLKLTLSDQNTSIVVDHFEKEIAFQGIIFPQGAPLTALQEGFALPRNSPKLRRFLALAQTAIGPGDPAIWSSHFLTNFLTNRTTTHVLQMPTAGDSQVPVNTGVAAARISGLFGSWLRDEAHYSDPRFGWREIFQPVIRYENETLATAKSIDQLLIDRYVVEGDGRLQRYRSQSQDEQIRFDVGDQAQHPNTIFDIDNVSDGAAIFSCGPSDWSAINGESGCPKSIEGQEIFFPIPYEVNPLRLNRQRADESYDAFRIPVMRPAGQHGIYNAQPFRKFDTDAFMVNFTTRFLGSNGRFVDHLAGCDCSIAAMHTFELNGTEQNPAINQVCQSIDLKLCSHACADGWGMMKVQQTSRCDSNR